MAAVVAVVALALLAVAGGAPRDIPTVEIAPGVMMPVVGLGSCCGTYNVTAWIEQGYRNIDTSCDYGSQPTIGAAIKASGVPRSEFFITSKINVESCSENVTDAVIQLVLQPLGVDYVDLLLLHHAGRWQTDNNPRPPCFNASDANGRGTYYQCRIITLQSFVQVQKMGLTRAFGVSNWQVRDLQQLKDATGIVPAINQIELHPYFHNNSVIEYCQQNNIFVTGYAPFANAHFDMINNPAFVPIAQAHGVSVSQVILAYNLRRGASIVIPRSQTPAHMALNVDVFGFKLTDAEFQSLDNFTQQKVYHTDCQDWC